jgi:hypothetical protein
MQLPPDPQPTDCYEAKACVAPLAVVHRPSRGVGSADSSSVGGGVVGGGELVAAEAALSVWYWVAPAEWFVGVVGQDVVGPEAGRDRGNILGLVLQLRLATDASPPVSPVADGNSMVCLNPKP